MTTLACPHCSSANNTGDAFCKACGMALPQPQNNPRIVGKDDTAATKAGVSLQADELQTQLKRSSSTLLVVAVIQTIASFLSYAITTSGDNNFNDRHAAQMTMAIMLIVAAIFWGLYFWSRRAPLAAAIVALVVYVSFWMLDLVSYFIIASRNEAIGANQTSPITSGIIVKIFIILLFIRAIKAGIKYRTLQSQQLNTTGTGA